MKISLTEIEEGQHHFDEGSGDQDATGFIIDYERNIARYYVAWNIQAPDKGVVFDLVYGTVADLPPGEKCIAISFIHYGLGEPTLINSASRPFAKRLTKYCDFYGPDTPSDELLDSARNTIDYILRHDSRLIGCFGGQA